MTFPGITSYASYFPELQWPFKVPNGQKFQSSKKLRNFLIYFGAKDRNRERDYLVLPPFF